MTFLEEFRTTVNSFTYGLVKIDAVVNELIIATTRIPLQPAEADIIALLMSPAMYAVEGFSADYLVKALRFQDSEEAKRCFNQLLIKLHDYPIANEGGSNNDNNTFYERSVRASELFIVENDICRFNARLADKLSEDMIISDEDLEKAGCSAELNFSGFRIDPSYKIKFISVPAV